MCMYIVYMHAVYMYLLVLLPVPFLNSKKKKGKGLVYMYMYIEQFLGLDGVVSRAYKLQRSPLALGGILYFCHTNHLVVYIAQAVYCHTIHMTCCILCKFHHPLLVSPTRLSYHYILHYNIIHVCHKWDSWPHPQAHFLYFNVGIRPGFNIIFHGIMFMFKQSLLMNTFL